LERFQPQGRTSSGLYFGRLPPSSTIFFHHRFSFNFYNSSCVAKNTSLPQVEGAEGGKEERWRGNMQTLDSAQIWRRNTAQKFKRFDPRARSATARNEQTEKQLRESTKIKSHPQMSTRKSHAKTGDAHFVSLSLSLSLSSRSSPGYLLTSY
jgi:hypothetical protein